MASKKFKPDFSLDFDLSSTADNAIDKLLSDTSKDSISHDQTFKIKNIKIDDIEENKYDEFSKDHVDYLFNSIKLEGLNEPLTVYKQGKKYIILSGHSRFQAIQKIRKEDSSKFTTIPCSIIDHTFVDESDEKKALAKYNQTREKNNKDRFLEYITYKDFYEKNKEDFQAQNINFRDYISINMEISKDHVSRYRTIDTKCIKEIKDLFLQNKITLIDTRNISTLKQENQKNLFNKAKIISEKENNNIEDVLKTLYSEYKNSKITDKNKEKNNINSSDLKESNTSANNKEDKEIINHESSITNEHKKSNLVSEDNVNIVFSLSEIKPHIPIAISKNKEKIKEYIFNLIIKAEDEF